MMSKNPLEEIADGADLLQEMLHEAMPSLFPAPAEILDSEAVDKPKVTPKKWHAHYGNFAIQDNTGNTDLERIMNRILDGEYVFGDETRTFDKYGVAFVLLKWYEPVT